MKKRFLIFSLFMFITLNIPIISNAEIKGGVAIDGNRLEEMDPSIVSGYYYFNDGAFLLMNNGKMYEAEADNVNASNTSTDFQVYGQSGHFIFEIDGETAAYFEKQDNKSRTETGGEFYAVYLYYLGDTKDVEYEEGKHILIGNHVFGNDYDVMVREPLANFFSINDDITSNYGILESSGYATPEDAVTAYIDGLAKNNIDEMVSSFAVETYIENFNLAAYVERLGAYITSLGFIPSISEYADNLNLEKRKANIIDAIRYQYMTIIEAACVTGDTNGSPMQFDSSAMTGSEFLENIFPISDEEILSNVKFDGRFINPELLEENYGSQRNSNYLKDQANIAGAEEIESLAAYLEIGDVPYLLCADTVRYGDIWYVLNLGGCIGNLLRCDVYNGGMIKIEDNDELIKLLND